MANAIRVCLVRRAHWTHAVQRLGADLRHLQWLPARPHGLVVRTPAFHAGDHRFESGWGYSLNALRWWGFGGWSSRLGAAADVDGSALEAIVGASVFAEPLDAGQRIDLYSVLTGDPEA